MNEVCVLRVGDCATFLVQAMFEALCATSNRFRATFGLSWATYLVLAMFAAVCTTSYQFLATLLYLCATFEFRCATFLPLQ